MPKIASAPSVVSTRQTPAAPRETARRAGPSLSAGRWLLLLLAATLTLAACPPKPPQPGERWSGKVVRVADGDTLTVLAARKQIKVRLHGVDCPERDQPFGLQAKRFTTRLVGGRQVSVRTMDRDRYGRQVASVTIAGQDLGEALVQAGLAWWYQRYAPQARQLQRLEKQARQARRGLWSEPQPLPPWRWRQRQRQRGMGRAEASPSRPQDKTKLGKLLGRKIGEVHGTAAVDVTHPVSGNVRSKVFHWFTCRHSNCPHCTARFRSIAEARGAGYRPHRACISQAEGTSGAGKALEAPGAP